MENLTRRAEWFLRPTTLPSLSFTPDGLKHLHENISVYDTHSQTAMSTISLLEMHRNMKDQLTTDIYVNSDLVQVVSPRILFTSSTSDLIQSNFSVQQTDPRVTLSVNEDCRTKLCPSLSPVYGHSFSSLINSPSPQFFVVSQSNNLFQHSTKYKDCEPNTSGYEQSVTTHSFLIPTALPINSSVDPLIYHHIPMHSLSHDRTEVSKLTALSGPDLLQSTSYESFPALTYSTLLHCMHSDLEEKTNKRENHTSNNNNKRVNNDDMTSNVPGDPSVITHDDIDDGQCELFSTAVKSPTICLGITSKSDMRSSDWSIDQPVLSENLHRRRSSALTTLYIPKK
ncbi:unnamed protein product [Heterobilharzia americana]|nr:unnamed protein product [Heterobilharzia americana]